jgi:hypothetical protein
MFSPILSWRLRNSYFYNIGIPFAQGLAFPHQKAIFYSLWGPEKTVFLLILLLNFFLD